LVHGGPLRNWDYAADTLAEENPPINGAPMNSPPPVRAREIIAAFLWPKSGLMMDQQSTPEKRR